MPTGKIPLDSIFAAKYGFTNKHFYPETYLIGNATIGQITIPMVISNDPGQGHFSQAVKNLLAAGFRVAIQTPVPRMQEILAVWGFKIVWDENLGVENWIYPPYYNSEK